MERQVVVTGLGLCTSLGTNVKTVWQKMLDGQSGVKPLPEPVNIMGDRQILATGAIENFALADLVPAIAANRELVRTAGRASRFALFTADQAVKDAGLPLNAEGKLPEELGKRTATCVGLSMCDGLAFCETHTHFIERGARRVSALTVPIIMPNAPAGHIAICFGAKADSKNIPTACSSGSDSVGEGFRLIRHGYADLAIVGGTDNLVEPFYLAAFGNAGALSSTGISRPFDAKRDGFVMGEGSGILVLEELQHALDRGAKIYCYLSGYGASCDAFHITQPEPQGAGGIQAMHQAFAQANLPPTAMNYYNAHGTSTPLNDKTETTLLKRVLGESAGQLVINSTKSLLGHCIGAAGAIEAVVCCLSISNSRIHPTINYANPDPECDLDYCVEGSRELKIKVAGSMSLGFGGHNAFLLFQKFE